MHTIYCRALHGIRQGGQFRKWSGNSIQVFLCVQTLLLHHKECDIQMVSQSWGLEFLVGQVSPMSPALAVLSGATRGTRGTPWRLGRGVGIMRPEAVLRTGGGSLGSLSNVGKGARSGMPAHAIGANEMIPRPMVSIRCAIIGSYHHTSLDTLE